MSFVRPRPASFDVPHDSRLGSLRPVFLATFLASIVSPSWASASPAVTVEDATPLRNAREAAARFVLRERQSTRPPALLDRAETGARTRDPRPSPFAESKPSLDCEHATHDIRLEPRTGVTSAHLDLRVRANGRALTSIGFIVDEGLGVGPVTADGRTVTVRSDVVPPSRVVQVDLSPPLAVGETTTLHVPYEGRLGCASSLKNGGVVCAMGDDFSYFAQQSIFPYVFDPRDPNDTTLDAMTRDLVLRVPSDVDVVATGEHVDDVTQDGETVSSWVVDKPLARTFGIYVFAGKLGRQAIAGRAVPTTLIFPTPLLAVDRRMTEWSGPILDFVEILGGAPLPFQRSLTLVRMPASIREAGTATFGMTTLSESYATAGDLFHEETWAHENTHLFWGITVPETSASESRLLSEGLATLFQLDYTWARHFADDDRDTYLARRLGPMGLDVRALGHDVPPIQVTSARASEDLKASPYTLWAYYKPALALDHLRTTIGERTFGDGLTEYVRRCSYVGCRPDDFRAALEDAARVDLRPFFERWITADTRPAITIGFERNESGGASIVVTKDDASPMTIELWLDLDDGQRVKRHVDLHGFSTATKIGTGAGVRSVSMNPRHEVLVAARSNVVGDLDFDGEVDGFDVLRCSPLLGRSYLPDSAGGLWKLDEAFDPRCDVNGDMHIDDADMAMITPSFGALRRP